jgi:dynein heavy chain 2|tara:strand:+ start:893 stop:1090 length:198 start_codon:yes stop_codon:yes gene_type:complete
MSNLEFVLYSLNTIQRKWVYLEPIFARGSLPNEARRFRGVDGEFREILSRAEADPKLLLAVPRHR